MGHCFSDIVTPFISGDPTSVVVVNVDVAVADMTGAYPGILAVEKHGEHGT